MDSFALVSPINVQYNPTMSYCGGVSIEVQVASKDAESTDIQVFSCAIKSRLPLVRVPFLFI